MSNIRVRIAPSPTGALHIGTARTALFNYLFAKHNGGQFILRVEDTDLERSDKKFEKDIFEGLAWLGIITDESPEKGGSFGPYRQTERTETYVRALKKLLKEEKAFYCFHSEEELENEREGLKAGKKAPIHSCEFRTLEPKEAETLAETKANFIIRFKTPLGKIIIVDDIIRGCIEFSSSIIGDFSLAKKIDIPLYNFAVVVDDFEMQISHVIRGEDHIPNTPKQMLLIEALGYPQPQYAHLPLVLGEDRSKLSKRHGHTSLLEYQKNGYLPEALFNFIALLGWNAGDNQELFSEEELINLFSLEHVQKSGAIFDFVKLDWMNGEYIRKLSLNELFRMAQPFLPSSKSYSKEYIKKVLALEQSRLKKLSELSEKTDYFFNEPNFDTSLLSWKNMSQEEIKESLAHSEKILSVHSALPVSELKMKFLEEGSAIGDRGKLLWPLRVALSGKKSSPDPFEIIEILGVEETLRRISEAKKKLL